MFLKTKSTPQGRIAVCMVTGKSQPYHDSKSYNAARQFLIEYRNQCFQLAGISSIERLTLPELQQIFQLHFVIGYPRLPLP
jgi:hypothetical protein